MSLAASPPYLSGHPDGVVVDVWAAPGARSVGIAGVHGGALHIRVTAPPEQGKANAALAELLAGRLGVRRVELLSGASSRRKRFLAVGADLATAARRLAVEET